MPIGEPGWQLGDKIVERQQPDDEGHAGKTDEVTAPHLA